VNEVIDFFVAFCAPPLSSLLPQPFVIEPLSQLIENPQRADQAQFFGLIERLLKHVVTDSDRIQLFFLSERSSPLIHQFAQLIVTRYAELGDVFLHLIVASKTIPGLLESVTTYSPLVSTLIALCHEAFGKKQIDLKLLGFMRYLNLAVAGAPEFGALFAASFRELVTEPLIIKPEPRRSLENSIYFLSTFSADALVRPVFEYVLSVLNFAGSEPDTLVLKIRLLNLMFETFNVRLPIAPPSVKISLDFIGLINSEWFVRSDINQQLQNARSLVSMSLSGIPRNPLEFDLGPFLPELLRILADFLDNSIRVNLALTEFFATIAASWGNEATFFALSDENENGLYQALVKLCVVVERRVGKRPGTIQAVERAYQVAGGEAEDPELGLFKRLVMLLEFLKELHAIAQSKNLLRQRDSLVLC
jgi:hypothetical protein